MNDMDQNLKGAALPSVYRAADGSGAGAPRDEDPRRNGIDLGDMLEMGLESLLMHFRRKPDARVTADKTTPGENRMDPEG
ncbi:hypothetical protein DLREEDagr8_42420 [Dongia sp. agr-C8]